jgi:hypothetical protein
MSLAAIQAELAEHQVVLVSKGIDPLMRFLGIFLGKRFLTDFWTTYRLPGGRPRICYPLGVKDPMSRWPVIAHELVHVRQFAPAHGPLAMLLLSTLFPLPAFFSGRWYIERRAYLRDVLAGHRTIDEAVDTLWRGYGWCWPKPLMRRWFEREVARARR